ncbi:MAG: RluA family pseudouridine synthase [Candidatus Omnitrophica bacterium]|nr:RluA family pseudouridine synthase [Candidatus Omnitrophota bacterium]
MRTYQFHISAKEAGARLDQYLVQRLPQEVSRAMVQRGIRARLILVDGKPAKASTKLRSGSVVTAPFEELPAPARDVPLTPQDIPLEIVYEDDLLLVVNKPPGLVVHPAPGHWEGTLVNAILWHLASRKVARSQGRKESLDRAGIVHRLDKDTSGLLLVAKTAQAQLSLSRQLKARTVKRRYLAAVEGHLPLNTGTINAPLGRHATHRKEITVRHLGGRSAVTHYRVLHRDNVECRMSNVDSSFGIRHSKLAYSVVDIALETGRTHQIRVHMAHLGYPVLGDLTYGKRPASFWHSLGITRQLLHAYAIQFQHPSTHCSMALTCPPPEDMVARIPPQAISDIKRPFDI